jgi:hypothetical protein
MLRKLKALFAADRWEIRRISYWVYGGRQGIRETKFHLRNRYNGRLKLVTRDGEWYESDFHNKTYRR